MKTLDVPSGDVIAHIIQSAIKAKSDSTERTIQSKEGRIGPSDIGFCRQKAVLMTQGVPMSDTKPTWAADVGTAIHWWVENALADAYPTWLCGPRSVGRVTAILPNGSEVSGTPDVVVPEWNAVLDIKTKDGLESAKRNGTTQAHKYQRALYAMGLLQAGVLDETKQVMVGNVYLDRSGADWMPYVEIEAYDPFIITEIDQWVEDVIYAVKNREDGSRDVAAPVCERICEWYTACRGNLPMRESDVIEDEELVAAADMYDEGRALEKRGKAMKDEAKRALDGVNGLTTSGLQVRWTMQSATEVAGFTRDAHMKIDVRRVKGRS